MFIKSYIRRLKIDTHFHLKIFKSLFQKNVIISRTACLGNDSMAIAGISPLINIQKGRIDLLTDKLKGNYVGPLSKDCSLIKREDLLELYLSQKIDFKKIVKNADKLIMDSYSELTDQVFLHKTMNNIRFNANYSDVDELYVQNYICEG